MSSLDTAFTLTSTSSLSSPNPELFTPPPSHTSLLQVPDVFVIPPEEEHEDNPPFCYFDAAMESKRDLSVVPDIDALDVALGFYQQTEGNPAPIFHRIFGDESQETVVMPRRSDERPLDTLSVIGRTPRMLDEDVVEVVKVRKSEGVSNSPDELKGYTLKKSKTFRMRASQALRSIKNVGRSNRRTGIPETWSAVNTREPPSEITLEDGILAARSTPSLVRRKSTQLSQIFAGTRSRSPAPDVPLSPTSPTESEWSALSRPSPSPEDCMNAPHPSSPLNPEGSTLSKRRSFVRRMSVLDLHKLFSPSTPTSPKPPPPISRSKENIAPSQSHSSSKRDSLPVPHSTPSDLSSPEDVFSSVSTNSRPHSFHASGTRYSLSTPSGPALGEADEMDADMSLELRLDSLHFDSLHFDPDEFDPDEF
jgi:hypothetical protein